MIHRADIASAALAIAIHAGAAWLLVRTVPEGPGERSIVEVEIVEPKAPPPSAPAPPEPRRERRLAAAQPDVARPAQAPPTPARGPPPPPVFGFSMDSTAPGDAAMAVPIGNTTAIDPAKSAPHAGPVRPLRPSGGAGPGGDLAIRSMPDVDAEECGRTVAYPKEAESAGVEGTVKLRISLDERGRVVDVKVLSGPGHGLDQAAVEAVTHRCRFTPAIASDGSPVAFVIDPYSFHFVIPR